LFRVFEQPHSEEVTDTAGPAVSILLIEPHRPMNRGQMQVYVRPFPGPDRRWQVSTQGGTRPLWSRNGKEIFYRVGNKMMVVEVSAGVDLTLSQPRQLFEHRYVFQNVSFANYDVSPDGQRFVMVNDEAGSGRLNVVLNWTEDLKRAGPHKFDRGTGTDP
jgi:hypothetical protein